MTKRRKQRGFALLIVVMLVALLAVTGAALLDLVAVDLDIVGEQKRLATARSLAESATFETADSTSFSNYFPDFTPNPLPPPGYGAHSVIIPTPNPPQTSLVKEVGTRLEENYNSVISLLRFTPGVECSFNVCRNAFYELTTQASINQGDVTSEVRSIIVKSVTHPKGKLLPRVHAR